jgi:hypothetical protein
MYIGLSSFKLWNFMSCLLILKTSFTFFKASNLMTDARAYRGHKTRPWFLMWTIGLFIVESEPFIKENGDPIVRHFTLQKLYNDFNNLELNLTYQVYTAVLKH